MKRSISKLWRNSQAAIIKKIATHIPTKYFPIYTRKGYFIWLRLYRVFKVESVVSFHIFFLFFIIIFYFVVSKLDITYILHLQNLGLKLVLIRSPITEGIDKIKLTLKLTQLDDSKPHFFNLVKKRISEGWIYGYNDLILFKLHVCTIFWVKYNTCHITHNMRVEHPWSGSNSYTHRNCI